MSKERKRDDVVEQQHAHQMTEHDILVPMDETNATDADTVDLADLRDQFAADYEKRRAAEFEQSRQIAEQRLVDLEATGFNPPHGGFDPGSTTDGMEQLGPYDHYQHIGDNGEVKKPVSADEHSRSRKVK